jgi:PqqD family protein of HPr-rel-A system
MLRSLGGSWDAATDLVWTHFDDSDESVVFNAASGDVHLVSASAYALWNLIASGPPRSAEQLVGVLALHIGRAVDEEFSTVTRETLDHMDRAGLIVPARS